MSNRGHAFLPWNLPTGNASYTVGGKNSLRHRAWGILLGTLPSPVWAQGAEVLIRCDEINAEERARVEVRLLTELRTLPGAPGTLELTCTSTTVQGGWRTEGGLHDTRNLSVAPGDNRTEMLLWIGSLLLETQGDRQKGKPDEAQAPTPPSPQDRQPPEPSAPAPEATSEEAPSPPDAEEKRPTPDSPSEVPPNQPPPRHRRHFGVDVGALYSHYGSEMEGALGPHLGAELGLVGPFGLSAHADLLFGTRQPRSIGVLEGVFFVGGSFSPTSWARLLVGPTLSVAELSAANASRVSVTAGFEASARAAWARPFGVFVQVGLRVLADERRVVLGQSDGPGAWSGTFIPAVSPFAALGGTFERAPPAHLAAQAGP